MVIPLSRSVALAAFLAATASASVHAQADALVSQAREVQSAVADIRGLSFLHPVRMAVKDRQAIRAYAVSRLDREYTPADFHARSESLIAWGFVPRPFDLRSLYEELFAEQIGGYYDPFERTFFIADWLPALLQKPIMAHELTHALQDQHFDLKPLLRGVKSNDDASLAGAAVVEGEGLAVMIDYALQPVGVSFEDVPDLASLIDSQLAADTVRFRIYASAPRIVKETLLFPYLSGLLFIRAAKQDGGWGSVSRLYRGMPTSTEQILWPEKYFGRRDEPTPVELPDVARLLGRGWKRIDSNVLGELGSRIALQIPPGPSELSPAEVAAGAQPHSAHSSDADSGPRASLQGAPAGEADAGDASRDPAVEAARGWDGDRYELYERNPGETALVSVSIWDAEAEAEEFEQAWRGSLERFAVGRHRVMRKGTVVLGVVDVPPDRMDRVLKVLLSAAPAAPVS